MRRNLAPKLKQLYDILDEYFGDLHWWPGDSQLEIIVGAILTQSTNWSNVVKAIENLREAGLLSVDALVKLPEADLAEWIRPCGYYNIKARRLKNFLTYLSEVYQGSLHRLFAGDSGKIRQRLLSVNGIGEETADSILLYAADRPVFVVDAYTKRLLFRHGLIEADASYQDVQALFMDHLPASVPMFNQFHALIVETGKRFCRKMPLCQGCPLHGIAGLRMTAANG